MKISLDKVFLVCYITIMMIEKDNPKNRAVSIKVSNKYYDKLIELAKKEKRTISDFIRLQLEKLIPE